MSESSVTQRNKGWIDGLLSTYKQLEKQEIVVGFPQGTQQAYPDGESVVEVAARHVFGIGVVQRDFMSYAKPDIQAKTKPILQKVGQLINQSNLVAARKLMDASGLVGSECIKSAIIEGSWAPNSDRPMGPGLAAVLSEKWGKPIDPDESYREAKQRVRGSDKPLIDTAHMVNSVTFAVREKE